jgi:ribosomal protein S18 acetylase RimI-like enzyme
MSIPPLPDGLIRRPATESEADREILYRLYATTREADLIQTNWSGEQKTLFIQQQFHAQHTYYHQQWPNATYDVIEFHGTPIGRIYVDLRPAVHIMEITLFPEFRGRGLGTALIQQVIALADEKQQPTQLFVESWNPAQRLYARLGFVFTEDHGIYQLLTRPYSSLPMSD